MTYLSDKYNFTITPKLPKKEKENPPWNNLTLFNPKRKVLYVIYMDYIKRVSKMSSFS